LANCSLLAAETLPFGGAHQELALDFKGHDPTPPPLLRLFLAAMARANKHVGRYWSGRCLPVVAEVAPSRVLTPSPVMHNTNFCRASARG
jgi:hypothetical protein